MINAAYDLGATPWQMLKEVMLPYLTPGIISGFFMAFTYSLDDFAVTFFVTGMVFQLFLLKFTHVQDVESHLRLTLFQPLSSLQYLAGNWLLLYFTR